VAWQDLVKNDGQRGTAIVNWRQLPETKKAKRSSDDAATDEYNSVFVLRRDVAETDNIKKQ